MSKQCPSRVPDPADDHGINGHPSAESPRLRLFRNSYTRDGECFVVDGWSVKIQHRGRRRTFSLSGATRQEATLEAKAIHDTIRTEGWEAASRSYPPRGRADGKFSKMDARYWKPQLVVRRYRFEGAGGTDADLTVWIDHMGVGYFFPLGTSDHEAAAARAAAIYRTVVKDGWGIAGRKFPRELIVGFEWSSNPILWTYTTVHTLVGRMAEEPQGGGGQSNRHILLVESDPGLRRALAWCLRRHKGISSVAWNSGESLESAIGRCKPDLILLNRNLAGRLGCESPGQLAAFGPGIAALAYSTYAEGDQMFVSTPGGSEGYLLKRLSPDRVLEPVLEAVGFSVPELLSRVKSFFKGLLQPRPDANGSGLARVTPREREVLMLLSKGCVDKEIAQALGISAWTVHGHIKKIFERLQVRTRTEAVVRYLEK